MSSSNLKRVYCDNLLLICFESKRIRTYCILQILNMKIWNKQSTLIEWFFLSERQVRSMWFHFECLFVSLEGVATEDSMKFVNNAKSKWNSLQLFNSYQFIAIISVFKYIFQIFFVSCLFHVCLLFQRESSVCQQHKTSYSRVCIKVQNSIMLFFLQLKSTSK